ncbi:MAG TPA: MFS transporter [Rhizomicrobium sp.]|nr:MFS transporter [Rhizomicrobium sp.]
MTGPELAIYRLRDFHIFISSRFLSTVAMMVQSVAIGWQVFDITHKPLSLGIVGLCQFLPMFLFTLPAGEISDRFDQRRVLVFAQIMQGACAGLFLVFSILTPRDVLPFYAVLVLFGIARGFAAPAGSSLLAFLVPPEKLARGIALSSSAFTTAVIAGPALGGFAYALGPVPTYGLCLACFLLSSFFTGTLGGRRIVHAPGEASRLERVKEGIRFVWERPIVLGAISLDLFAVLLGGAVAMLPVYARDIIHVVPSWLAFLSGPARFGLLRSAPAAGAALVAFTLARWPVKRGSGVFMFSAVAVFGIATIVFGISDNFLISLAALFVTGASDMISVFIRSTLINFATPDPMRGRVGAVNMLFIGASNELGEFESGVTAQWLGTVPSVILGGIGTMVVVAVWMALFPPLRKVDRLEDVAPA